MKTAFVGSVAILICGFSPPSSDLQLDFSFPEIAETSYVFHCEGRRTQLRFVEEKKPGSEVTRLADRWRIRLVELSVAGRSIQNGGPDEAARALNRYSWLTRVQGRCAGGDGINIWIEGMPAEDWADFAEGRIESRPRTSSNQIDIDRDGQVTVR